MSLRDEIARAIVAKFPARSHPDNDDFAEALSYADAVLPLVVAREVADELAADLDAAFALQISGPIFNDAVEAALAKYRERVECPDDDNYGQYNRDGSPKQALRRTLKKLPVCTCGAGNSGWMNHSRECPVRVDAVAHSIEERARRHQGRS